MTSPIATPATAARIGTPASISESEPPQTVAIDEEPFDSVMSETIRHGVGPLILGRHDRFERACGRGRRGRSRGDPGCRVRPVSPTEKGGKL
jgi:hypothetical protein